MSPAYNENIPNSYEAPLRSEQEMLDLILTVARADERIRAVVLNGSRANPNAPRDLLQDFDVIYLVRGSSEPFRADRDWIGQFGELMILQLPEEMGDPPPSGNYDAVYLAQFMDGNRIDLSVYPLERWPELKNDSLSVLLLDKDGAIGALPPASEASTSRPQRERSAARRCHRGQPSATTAGPSKKWMNCAPAKYVG